jgi:hypothetical protein
MREEPAAAGGSRAAADEVEKVLHERRENRTAGAMR